MSLNGSVQFRFGSNCSPNREVQPLYISYFFFKFTLKSALNVSMVGRVQVSPVWFGLNRFSYYFKFGLAQGLI